VFGAPNRGRRRRWKREVRFDLLEEPRARFLRGVSLPVVQHVRGAVWRSAMHRGEPEKGEDPFGGVGGDFRIDVRRSAYTSHTLHMSAPTSLMNAHVRKDHRCEYRR
jgi:hypothetical protein